MSVAIFESSSYQEREKKEDRTVLICASRYGMQLWRWQRFVTSIGNLEKSYISF